MTSKTPGIRFDEQDGRLVIIGRSLPENAAEFYGPLFDAIEAYKKDPNPKTQVQLCLEYFNTSSSRILLDLIKSFAWLQKTGKTALKVVWQFEKDDLDMEDAGNEYKQILEDIEFEIVQVDKFNHRDN